MNSFFLDDPNQKKNQQYPNNQIPQNYNPMYGQQQQQQAYGQQPPPQYGQQFGLYQPQGPPQGQPQFGNNNPFQNLFGPVKQSQQPFNQQQYNQQRFQYGQQPRTNFGQQQQPVQPQQRQQNYGQPKGNNIQPAVGEQQKYQTPYNPPKTTQSVYYKNTSTNVSDPQKQQKNIYPELSQYKPPEKEVGSQDVQYVGWAETKSKQDKQNDQLGETKYVKQVGKLRAVRYGSSQTMFEDQMGQMFAKNLLAGQKPTHKHQSTNSAYAIWDEASKNLHMQGSQFTGGQMGQMGQGRQPSLWDQIDKNAISFHLNPIFNKNNLIYQFPSPFIKYKIIPYLDEKKVLDVTSVNDSKKGYKKNNLIIWDYHGGPNQLFYINQQQTRPKTYYIVSLARGFAARIPDKQDGPVYVSPLCREQGQLWKLIQAEDSYLIQSVQYPGMVLDLYHQQSNNGTSVILWKRTGGKNQKWRIVPS